MPSTINIGKPNPIRGEWFVRYGAGVEAGQTFTIGDWVYLNTAGNLAICASPGSDVGAIFPMGIALANAVDYLADPGQFPNGFPVLCPGYDGEFAVAVYHGSPASAALAATDIDQAASTVTLPMRNQGGQWVANRQTNGTNDKLVIVERHPRYPFSEQYGWFWAKLMPASRVEAAS